VALEVRHPYRRAMKPLDSAAKAAHRAMWSMGDYDRFARETVWDLGPVLVEACGITRGQHVLDVAAGTGNVALRAAMAGASVVASDLTPELFEGGRRAAGRRGRAPRMNRGRRGGAALRRRRLVCRARGEPGRLLPPVQGDVRATGSHSRQPRARAGTANPPGSRLSRGRRSLEPGSIDRTRRDSLRVSARHRSRHDKAGRTPCIKPLAAPMHFPARVAWLARGEGADTSKSHSVRAWAASSGVTP
jgi:hypothetical protein